jgi:hypothetical protein
LPPHLVLCLALTLALSAGSLALAHAHLRRIRRASSLNLRPLEISLKRLPAHDRPRELARRALPNTWEHRLAEDLLQAPTDAARIAAANDALADMELTLAATASWPRAAVRICAFGTMLLAVIAFLLQRSAEPLLVLLAIGAAAAFACAGIDRKAKGAAREKRESIDALITTLMGTETRSAPDAPSSTPPRRRRPSSTR